jgi:hypothetical protein
VTAVSPVLRDLHTSWPGNCRARDGDFQKSRPKARLPRLCGAHHEI